MAGLRAGQARVCAPMTHAEMRSSYSLRVTFRFAPLRGALGGRVKPGHGECWCGGGRPLHHRFAMVPLPRFAVEE